jgi:ABC-type sugar transport system substrate-binding protein
VLKISFVEELEMKRILVALLVLVALLSACSKPKEAASTGSSGSGAKTYVFGVGMPQLDNDGFRANLIGIRQAAEELGNITLQSVDAQNTADRQLQQIEDFITKKVDAIIMCPVDSGAAAQVVKKANAAGIPIVSFDRNINDGVLAGLAESDNVAHGAKAAELLRDAANKLSVPVAQLQVLELWGSQQTTAGLQRHQGFESKAKELGISIVAQLPTDFKADIAYNAVLDAFQANSNINAIYVPSDNALYQGVEAALKQLGKLIPSGEPGHIIITTVDGGPLGLKGIRNGYIDAIAAQSKLVMSIEAVKIAYATVQGNPPANKIIQIQPTPVTKENVDDPHLWANAINTYAL